MKKTTVWKYIQLFLHISLPLLDMGLSNCTLLRAVLVALTIKRNLTTPQRHNPSSRLVHKAYQNNKHTT